MIRSTLFCLFLFGATQATCASSDSFYSSGSADIDRARKEVAAAPTDESNHRERTLLLYMWLGALQHQGADTRSFFDIDRQYYRLEPQLNRAQGEQLKSRLTKMCQLIDRGYQVMEEIQTALVETGPMSVPRQGDPDNFPAGGNMDADWPMFQGNKHNTGYTEAPGPRLGKNAWKFPVGLGWYARPVVEGNRVYVASPGMHTTSYCLDLATGKEIWKSTQQHPLLGIYKYPAIASTPLIVGDKIVLREVNSHGGNTGQAKNLVYLDKKTGKTVSRKYAGHVDYRTQYAAVASNGEYVVYPYGVHDIYGSPAICQNFNRLICADKSNSNKLWDFNVGDIDALAEPVVTKDKVFQGTMEGYLYALNLKGGWNSQRIAWKFKAAGPVNTRVELEDRRIYFGANGGSVYCLDQESGKEIWQTRVTPVEQRARKHFSTPVIEGDRLYVGAANRRLYCLNKSDGEILWERQLGDWIRCRPVTTSEGIFVATVDGKLSCIGRDGSLKWTKAISTHPIYADMSLAGERLLINDSNLYLYCIDLEGELVWKKSLLDSFTDEAGERIFTDQLSGGTYYQSKPTAYRNKLYFGSPAGFLYALDAESGKEIWKFEMGAAISVGPACADGKIYAGQQGGERFFYCVDAEDGSLVWKQTVPGGWVWGSAAVDDGMVYVPTVNGYAVCLDGETGQIVWMFPTANSVPAEPAIDGDLVYFGSWSRSLYAFDKKTGEVIWKENGIGLDSGTLIAYQGKIYLPHHDSIFKNFDAQTGEMLSQGNLNDEEKGNYSNFNATPAFHDGRGYYTARGGIGLRGVPLFSTVYCVDAQTAKIQWTFPDGGGLSAPAIANGRVYIGSGNTPFLYCLDELTGKPYWIYKMGHRIEEATLCIYRDRLYALAADGFVHAID